MFKLYRAKRKLRIKEAELVASQYDAAIQTIDKALEARNVVVDQDALSGWIPLGSDGGVTEEDHRNMLESAYNFYHTNPHARAVIRNLVKFTLGKGPLVIPEAENEKVKEIWDDFKDENNFNIREKEIARRTFRDGEVFLRLFINKNDGTVKIRFIRAGMIRNPNDKKLPENVTHGIMTKVDDIETPLLYYKTNADGTFSEAFKAEEIIHIKIFADSDEKRGISQLRVIARRLKQYEGWLEDRIVLNKIRTAIALIKKYDTSSQKLKQIRDENMSDQLSATRKRQQAFSAGTVIHSSKGVEYELLTPNINASDVEADGRAILLAIAAAVGFPEMILTADYSNANYSSSLIAQNPFVREIEDWQDFFSTFYRNLFAVVVQASIDSGELPKNTSTKSRIEFPPMILADLEKIAKAFEILFKFKAISKKTWQHKMGLDHDIEKNNMDADDSDDVFGPPGTPGGDSPFRMPMAPRNQFGADLLTALKEQDWDRIIEIVEEMEDEYPEYFTEDNE